MRNKLNKFSVVIPIFNEEKNLNLLIKKINKSLKTFKFEIILVDDDSTDNSHTILRKLRLKNSNLRFYIRRKNKDLSKSCIFGFNKAKFKNIIVMDGDLQHEPKYIPKMIKLFITNDLDFVVGTRNFKTFGIKGLNFFRFWASKVLMNVFFVFVGKKTSDPMSGFFIFKKAIFKKNKVRLFSRGFKILSDLLYSNKKIIKVQDYKINFNLRKAGKSKMNFQVLLNLLHFIIFNFFRNLN